MSDRIEIYSGDELVGTVPRPRQRPDTRDVFDLIMDQPYTLGIRRVKFEDQFATAVTFKIVWRECNEGWGKKATLVCSEMYGPGDWECVPGFVFEPPHTSRGYQRA